MIDNLPSAVILQLQPQLLSCNLRILKNPMHVLIIVGTDPGSVPTIISLHGLVIKDLGKLAPTSQRTTMCLMASTGLFAIYKNISMANVFQRRKMQKEWGLARDRIGDLSQTLL